MRDRTSHKSCTRTKKKTEGVKYKKKNTESNISNQVFSFICNKTKSRPYLVKILKHYQLLSAKNITLFYSYMSVVKRSKTKYMNKKILAALYRIHIDGLFHVDLVDSGVITTGLSL